MTRHALPLTLIVLAAVSFAYAGPDDFHPGNVIAEFGKVAKVRGATSVDRNADFKVAFDVSGAAEHGKINRHLDSAARLINMHEAAGVPAQNTQVAIVVHGAAHKDLLNDEAHGGNNANAPLIAALAQAGARIVLCGQTAVYYDVDVDDLLPGVDMGLSAMTEHALLQQAGYTLNPF